MSLLIFYNIPECVMKRNFRDSGVCVISAIMAASQAEPHASRMFDETFLFTGAEARYGDTVF